MDFLSFKGATFSYVVSLSRMIGCLSCAVSLVLWLFSFLGFQTRGSTIFVAIFLCPRPVDINDTN